MSDLELLTLTNRLAALENMLGHIVILLQLNSLYLIGDLEKEDYKKSLRSTIENVIKYQSST